MLLESLSRVVGKTNILVAASDTQPFLEDWRGRYRGRALCVALPADTRQVAETVRLCVEHGIPVLPQGGNTSLCGGAVPGSDPPAPVVVNLGRMRSIRAVDTANNAMCVDAGCILAAVQEAALEHGRLFPVSLGAEGSCQIGGAIATNAGGTGVLRYGSMRENVLGLEVVLPDGSLWDGLYALRKNNAGYDLKHIFIGSEGTLGIVTGAVLKLHPLPTGRSVAWVGVTDPRAALDLLGLFREACGARISGFELMNEQQVALVLEHVPGRRCPLRGASGWHVVVELSDTTDAAELDEVMQSVLERALARGLVRDAVIAASEAQRAPIWAFRHSVSEANKKGGIGLTTDCAVPISAVPAFIAAAAKAVDAIEPDLPIVVVAHLGDGNVHFIPFFGFDRWEAVTDKQARARDIRRAVNDVAAGLGGTFSAEHGIGRTLVEDMRRYKSPVELAMMHAIKRSLDPEGLFNPGRLLPPAS